MHPVREGGNVIVLFGAPIAGIKTAHAAVETSRSVTERKIELGVPAAIIEEHGVISAECAREMARVARERREASVGVGITGVAGPDEQEGHPAGTIHIAVDAIWSAPQTASYVYAQGRTAVKRRAVTTALVMLRQSLLNYRRLALV